MSVVLKIQNISKKFGSLVANDAVNLKLEKGEILALLGENGAGKTTLMNIIYGHYTSDSGHIEVLGKSLSGGRPREAIEAGIGMVHQHFRLVKSFTAVDNIALVINETSYHKNTNNLRQKILKKMDEIGFELELDSPVGLLSVFKLHTAHSGHCHRHHECSSLAEQCHTQIF